MRGAEECPTLHRSEKLASIGQLAAGVAHEINNPAAVIRSNLAYLIKAFQSGGAMPEDASVNLNGPTVPGQPLEARPPIAVGGAIGAGIPR